MRDLHPHVVRIMLTSDVGSPGPTRAIADGVLHRFLNKPMRAGEMAHVLRNAIATKQHADEQRRSAASAGSGPNGEEVES